MASFWTAQEIDLSQDPKVRRKDLQERLCLGLGENDIG